jgi:transposase
MDFLRLRSARLNENELCAVDSTSRTAYGDSLIDIRWGKNKENLPLAQTNEVVGYSLSAHMPIYYRMFPGNMPDCSSLDVILSDLSFAGFKNLVFITDRGYETIANLEKMINTEHSLIMCAKTGKRKWRK